MTDKIQELIDLRYDQKIDLYHQVAKFTYAKSRGLEYFLYKVFGSDLIGSIAFAMDPKWQLSKNPYNDERTPFQKIAPTTRVRQYRTWNGGPIGVTYGSSVRYDTGGTRFDPVQWAWVFVTSSETTPGPSGFDRFPTDQQDLYCWTYDTTAKQRQPLVNQGEFESFRPFVYGGCGYGSWTDVTRSLWAPDYNNLYSNVRHGRCTQPLMPVLQAASNTVWAEEKTNALSLMAAHADSLFAKALPSHRSFNLGYQLGELKDLPELLRGTMHLMVSLRRELGRPWVLFLKNSKLWTPKNIEKAYPYLSQAGFWKSYPKHAGDAFLNFKFGWQSLMQAIEQMSSIPPKISKRVNYLLTRQYQNSNFHSLTTGSTKLSVSPFTSGAYVPKWEHPDLTRENTGSPLSIPEGRAYWQLRCTINAFVILPPIEEVKLKKKLIVDLLGVNVEPRDIYDLIPWTWLLDWFNGLGDYVHVVDAVNKDRSLINWGLLSYKSRIKWHQTLHTVVSNTSSQTVIGGSSTTEIIPDRMIRRTEFSADYKLRKDLSVFTDAAKYTSTFSGLDASQTSIIGALLTKFT
jgi:hypothetical protein